VIAAGVKLMVPVSGADRTLESWRVTLDTPGGPLPFVLRIKHGVNEGTVHIGPVETIPVDLTMRGKEIIVDFPHYDSTLTLRRDSDETLVGAWRKVRGGSTAELRARAIRGTWSDSSDAHITVDPPASFSGRWRVEFESSDDDAIGAFDVFDLDGGSFAAGTFLTTTGDYRYLWGRIDGDLMRLSTFDGAHAFLFHARMQDDGTIEGDFWSGDWYHDTWTAVRDDDAALPDAFDRTSVVDEGAMEGLVFRDLDGDPTRVLDALDATGAPARIIEVFGTWCPNCADAARELASLKREYEESIGIVGLAFELTDDHERSAQQVRAFADRFGGDWEVLVAGLSDKDAATRELGFLDKVRSYPTTIFLDADNEIVEIHTGFAGPAAGDAHDAQRTRFTEIIDSIIERETGP